MKKRQSLDIGPKERYQHGDDTLVEATEDAGQTRVVILTRTALDRYHRRSQLDPDDSENNTRLYDAGVQFSMEWQDAGKEPYVISRYSDMVSSGSIQSAWAGRVESLAKWQRSVLAIGPIACNEVISVCCLGLAVGRERMVILRRGLDVLARHYGY